MKTQGFLALCVAAFLAAGCQSTPDERISKNQQAFSAMPADIQAKIRAGEVAVGFTPEQVRLARGEPDAITQRSTAAGEAEIWTFNKKGSGLGFGIGIGGGSGGMGGGVSVSSGGETEVELRVVFERGVVVAIEKQTSGRADTSR